MKTVVILYMFSTIMGAIVAVAGSFLFPLKITLADAVQQEAPKGVVEVLEKLLANIVSNPIEALVINYLGVLAWAVILGIALKKSTPGTKQMLSDASDAVSQAVRWIINLAPFGILGLVFNAVSTSGMEDFHTVRKTHPFTRRMYVIPGIYHKWYYCRILP